MATLCVNCADLITQVLRKSDAVQQLQTQVNTLTTNLHMYSNMLTNTTSFASSVWANVQSDIMQVRSLTNARPC